MYATNRLNIIVVDSDGRISSLYAEQLHKSDNNIIFAQTVQELKDIARQSHIHIAILDEYANACKRCTMLNVLKRLMPEIFIVGILKSQDTHKMITSIRKGARDFLIEPVCYTKLNKIANRALRLGLMDDGSHQLLPAILHDLRNNMQKTLSLTNTLYDSHQRAKRQEFIHALTMLNKQMRINQAYFNDALDWTRALSCLNTFRLENVNLYQLTQKVTGEFILIIEEPPVNIQIDIPESLFVKADKFMLAFILRNLIHNAIKFSGSKGKISISSYLYQKNARVVVSNNGQGMDEQTIDSILNGEYINGDSKPGALAGAGLALKVARSFLRKHNSCLHIVSKPGKGSYFYFHLPAHKQAVFKQELQV